MKRGLSFLVSLVFLMFLFACPTDSGNGGGGGGETPEVPSTVKLNIKGQQVIHEIWGEPEVDPRNAIGYQLEESGTPFFDRYVILYGGRIVTNNCVENPLANGTNCTKEGLHLHYGDNVYNHIWSQHATVLKPLQDAGIKVLMGLVPEGGGACIGSMYEWPMEPVWSWEGNNNGEPYPYGEAAVEALQDQIIAAINEFQLDGVGYDEEYGNHSSYSGQPGLGSVYPAYSGQYNYQWKSSYSQNDAWKKGGENLFRFAYNLQKKKPGIIQDVYEIRYGAYIPSSLTIDGKTVKMTDVFDISYEPTYGAWKARSSINMPSGRYGPVSIDICSGIQPTALPPYGRNGIDAMMQDHLAGNYGVNMFYCLRSHGEMTTRLPRYYGNQAPNPEVYLSQMSERLFGEKVIYVGDDYPRLW
jgi:hypothetical protein